MYLSPDGSLDAAGEKKLISDLKSILDTKKINIPNIIVPKLVNLMTYILKGVILLNKLAKGQPLATVPIQPQVRGANKRYRIVKRLSEGMGRTKKRKFWISKLERALGSMGKEDLHEEIKILKSHAIIKRPTHKTVALEREFTEAAMKFLKSSCLYNTDEEVASMMQSNNNLTD